MLLCSGSGGELFYSENDGKLFYSENGDGHLGKEYQDQQLSEEATALLNSWRTKPNNHMTPVREMAKLVFSTEL